MSDQITRNCHYVSRVATRNWHSKDKMLWYFDFEYNYIRRKSSRSLFSAKELNDQKEENSLKSLVEDPFASYMDRTIGSGLNHPATEKENLAMYLMVILQAPRYAYAKLGIERIDLNTILLAGEAELPKWLTYLQSQFDLVIITVPKELPVFFPEVGLYGIPYNNINAPFALTLSLHPRLVVSMVSKPNGGDLLDHYKGSNSDFLQCFSVGLPDHCKRVVIPPVLMEVAPEEAIIQQIREYREDYRKLVNHTGRVREKFLGLEPE